MLNYLLPFYNLQRYTLPVSGLVDSLQPLLWIKEMETFSSSWIKNLCSRSCKISLCNCSVNFVQKAFRNYIVNYDICNHFFKKNSSSNSSLVSRCLFFTFLKTFGKISTPEEEVIHKRLNMEWRLSNSCSHTQKKEEKEERKKAWVRK